MINANELRIGNWYKFQDGLGTWYDRKVYGFTEDGVYISEGSHYIDGEGREVFGRGAMKFEGIYPIPITEEWLLKFGFIKEEQGKGILYIEQYGFLALDAKFQPTNLTEVRYEMKYVHQLQNLHFAITGVELEIKALQTSP